MTLISMGPDSAEDLNIEQMLNEVNSQTKWPGRGKADAVLDQLFHGNVQKESKDNKPLPTRTNPTSIWNTLWNQM